MEYKVFIDLLKNNLEKMTDEDKEDFILELGNELDKSARANFLLRFKNNEAIDIDVLSDNIENTLSYVREHKLFKGRLEYEVDDYYDNQYHYYDDDCYDKIRIEDDYDIPEKIKEIFDLTSLLFLNGEYEKSYAIYHEIFHMKFCIESEDLEYGDEEERTLLDIEDVMDIDIDIMEETTKYLISIFNVYPEENLFDETYILFEWAYYFEFEEMLKFERINNFDLKLIEFLEPLKIMEGMTAYRMIKQIVSMVDVDEHQLVRDCASIHPQLFLDYIEKINEGEKYKEVVLKSKEAIVLISTMTGIREKICKLAEMACEELSVDGSNFTLEKFKSNSSVDNFLGLYVCCNDNQIMEALSHIENCKTAVEKSYNICRIDNKKLTKILSGDVELALSIYNEDKGYLGWSSNGKSEIMAMILLLLDKREVMTLAKEEIGKLITYKSNVIETWSNRLKDEIEINIDVEWLIDEVKKRTECFLKNANPPNHYKASAMVVYLAEVLKSNELIESKEETLDYFNTTYSRKRNFRNGIKKYLK